MQDDANTFIKRLFGFSFGPIIASFLGFILTPITTWLVVPDELGKAMLYSTALSFTALVIFLGIDQSFVREYSVEKNKEKLLWHSFLIPFTFSLVLSITYLFFSEFISNLLFSSNEPFIILILAISMPVAVFERFNLLLIRMQEKATLFSALAIGLKIIKLPLLILLLLFYERSFKSIILANFFSSLIISIIKFLINNKLWKISRSLDKELITKLIKYGLPLAPAAIFSWFLFSADKITLRAWSNFEQIGLYSAGYTIVGILSLLQSSFSTFWWPTAFRWYEQGCSQKRFILVSEKISAILIILSGLIILLKDIIIIIFSPTYLASSGFIPFLLFIPMMYTITETTKVGINASRKTGSVFWATGIASIINFIGNRWLILSLGGIGATISTAVSMVIYFMIITVYSRKTWIKLNLFYYIINIILVGCLAFVSVFSQNKILEGLIFGVIIIFNVNHLNYLLKIVFNQIITYTNKLRKLITKRNAP